MRTFLLRHRSVSIAFTSLASTPPGARSTQGLPLQPPPPPDAPHLAAPTRPNHPHTKINLWRAPSRLFQKAATLLNEALGTSFIVEARFALGSFVMYSPRSPRSMRPQSARPALSASEFDSHVARTHIRMQMKLQATKEMVAKENFLGQQYGGVVLGGHFLPSPRADMASTSPRRGRPASARVAPPGHRAAPSFTALNAPRPPPAASLYNPNISMLSEYAKAGTRIRPKSARATVGAYYMPAKTPLQLQPPNVQEMLMRQQHRLQMHLQRDARRKAESELTARQAAESEAARIRADIVRELEEKREREEAAELAKAVSAMGSRSMINAPVATQVLQPPPVNPHKYAHVTDAQLRNTHAIMKGRLEQLYGGVLSYIRKAFLYLDKDNTGTITPDELVDGMLSLNVNVPRHLLEHLINVCDYDRDGEIGYPEFARILQADDIVDIKAAGAEEEGLILKQPPKQYRNGITVEQMLTAHRQLKEFLTAEKCAPIPRMRFSPEPRCMRSLQ